MAENNLEPHECLFVDDKLELVNKARRLGLSGLHYKNDSSTQTLLHALEVIKLNDTQTKKSFFHKEQLPYLEEISRSNPKGYN